VSRKELATRRTYQLEEMCAGSPSWPGSTLRWSNVEAGAGTPAHALLTLVSLIFRVSWQEATGSTADLQTKQCRLERWGWWC
jgi:hypothetical protein